MSVRLRDQVTDNAAKWGLNRAQMLIFAYIAERIQEKKGDTWSFPKLESIQRKTGYCRRWVQINLRLLEQAGAFRVESAGGGRKHPVGFYPYFDEQKNLILCPPEPACVDQAQPESDQARSEKTLEEQLRFAKSIANKKYKVGPESQAFWTHEVERIEAAIAARDAPPISVDPAQPAEAAAPEEPEVEEPPVTLEECQQEIADWQEHIDRYRQQRDACTEFTPDWKYWQDRLNGAMDALYQWKQLARKAEAEALTVVAVAALSPPPEPGAGAYAL